MCLDITNAKLKTAKNDIVCFKVMKVGQMDNMFVSEYRHFKYFIGETYELGRPLVYKSSYHTCIVGEVEEGFHSFKFLSDAQRYLKATCFFTPKNPKYKIIRCVIPKNGKYFQGSYFGCQAYASDTIRIEEIIEEQ